MRLVYSTRLNCSRPYSALTKKIEIVRDILGSAKIINIGQYRNKSDISGTLLFHIFGYSFIFNRSSFIIAYLILDFRDRRKKKR